MGRELHHRAGRLQHPPRRPHDLPGAAGDGGRLQRHHEGGEALLRDGVPHPVRDAGDLRRAGPLPVLPLLGDDADPDVPHHRHLGRRAAHLRDGQVLPLHRLRQHPHARGRDLPRVDAVAHDGHHVLRLRRPLQGAPAARGPAVAARGLRAVLRDQGADGAVPHVAAGRARRGADRGLGDPRGRAPQDGHLRLHEAGLPLLPRRHAARDPAHRLARRAEHRLRRVPGARAEGHQEDHRLLVHQPPGLRDAGAGEPRPPGHPGRGGADGEPRAGRRRALPHGRDDLRALPHAGARRLRGAREGAAGVLGLLPHPHARLRGAAHDERVHGRVPGPHGRVQRRVARDGGRLGLGGGRGGLRRGAGRALHAVVRAALPLRRRARAARAGRGPEPAREVDPRDRSWRRSSGSGSSPTRR